MKTIAFPISSKENEQRRAVIPQHLSTVQNTQFLYFEKGYGEVLGIDDSEYTSCGCHVVSREELLTKDIICDLKVGDADFLDDLPLNTTIFGWIHAVQNRTVTDTLIDRKLTGFAMEDMYKNGRHTFWRNNEIAGEAAIMHAYLCHGIMPYNTKAAVIGKGNTGRGASKILTLLGAEIVQYDEFTEKLLRDELPNYDVVVNCVLWDVTRKDHLIFFKDLKRMKKGSLIIDVSCDRAGAIESSIPTTIENPTFVVDGVTHYAVDHTPSLFYKTFSKEVSSTICLYLDELITGRIGNVLQNAKIVEDGFILDRKISDYQKRTEVRCFAVV